MSNQTDTPADISALRHKGIFPLSFFAGTLLLAVIALLLISGSNPDRATEENPSTLSTTMSVEVPDEIIFADERVVFDRYDKRERMDRELNSFTYLHSSTLLLFKRANRIFPLIEPILKRQGVPEDIKYLAVIESSLNPRAVSPARAAGLWQFLQVTGRQFGLEVTAEVDERYHVERSTEAACRYLKQAYMKYGSWSAAALSYNGGQGRITGELNKQRATDALDLWLVEETSRYYYRMVAAKLIFEHPQQYGFVIRPDQFYKPMEFKEVKVSTPIPDLVAFAEKQGITYAQLKDFNSWLRSDKLTNKTGKSYTLLIPTQESLYYRKGEKPKIHDRRWVE